jgi:C-methyltransferase
MTDKIATPARLLQVREGLITHQALAAVASLGVADSLKDGPRAIADLARDLNVHEAALYRTLRLLASQDIFEETTSRTFGNTELSRFLCSGVPGSVRSLFIFWGSEFYYPPFGELLYSIQTGVPARTKLKGVDGFEYLRQRPDLARIFDDAMTNLSELTGPLIAKAYDFAVWESLMDVGGGNGILLSHILERHATLRGVLADQPHVLERARQRGFLNGQLQARTTLQACDFFEEIPSGCRAYLMKSVIHDWDDEPARRILLNCRNAVPRDGVLLLVELVLSEENRPSLANVIDLAMLVLTGGRERTAREYAELLAATGFSLDRVVPTTSEFAIIEAHPV